MTTPTATPEYTRRVIAPTATAEQLGDGLTDALAAISVTYLPLIASSTLAVQDGHGFEVAEQIIADLEHISTAAYDWMKRVGVTRLDAFDGISGAVVGVADYGALDDALDEHSAERIADNRGSRGVDVCQIRHRPGRGGVMTEPEAEVREMLAQPHSAGCRDGSDGCDVEKGHHRGSGEHVMATPTCRRPRRTSMPSAG